MGKDHKTPQAELDISWRTRELGPEMRRELFRKALPSVKFASPDAPVAAGDSPERHASAAAPKERRRGGEGRRASDRERRRDEPGSS